jgi:hypothetical protein
MHLHAWEQWTILAAILAFGVWIVWRSEESGEYHYSEPDDLRQYMLDYQDRVVKEKAETAELAHRRATKRRLRYVNEVEIP